MIPGGGAAAVTGLPLLETGKGGPAGLGAQEGVLKKLLFTECFSSNSKEKKKSHFSYRPR